MPKREARGVKAWRERHIEMKLRTRQEESHCSRLSRTLFSLAAESEATTWTYAGRRQQRCWLIVENNCRLTLGVHASRQHAQQAACSCPLAAHLYTA